MTLRFRSGQALRRTAASAAFICLLTSWSANPRADAANRHSVSPGRVVAIGDIHGSIDGLNAILRTAGLADGRVWTGGNVTLVQTDFTDRGTNVGPSWTC